jgi:hypothetical protein
MKKTIAGIFAAAALLTATDANAGQTINYSPPSPSLAPASPVCPWATSQTLCYVWAFINGQWDFIKL